MQPWIEPQEMLNWRLDPTVEAIPGDTHRWMGTGPGLHSHVAVGQVFGWVRN